LEEEEEEVVELPPTATPVEEGEGDAAGTSSMAGTATAALTREVGESKPNELDTPASCTARIREPSASLLLTSASKEAWVPASRRAEEEGVVKVNCQPAWAPMVSLKEA